MTDLSPERIAAAYDRIPAVFMHTPQFGSDDLSAALEREIALGISAAVCLAGAIVALTTLPEGGPLSQRTERRLSRVLGRVR